MSNNQSKPGLLARFGESKIHTKLVTLVGFFLVSFVLFAGLAWNTIDSVRIRGPYYNNIVQSKDLIADILPPPEYLIESYLIVLEMIDETDQGKLAAMIEKSKSLRADYETRKEFWTGDLPEGKIKNTLLVASYNPGMEFLEKRDKEFIPMILRGDRTGATALANTYLKQKYGEHRAAIDQVVSMSNEKYKRDEDAANAILRIHTILMCGFAAAIMIAMYLLCSFIIRKISGSLAEFSKGLDSASRKLTDVSQQMSANAEETSSQATVVSSSSHQVNQSVQTVAIGTEEMSASIREISKSTSESVRVAESAVKMAESTNVDVTKLGAGSEEIGEIINLITSIAEQTNLLALNAAIEAARAGEAGKGFAVVANEVKELARETAKATQDIKRKIGAIQSSTKGAIESISEIGNIIRQISDIQNTIASAVEEQTVTTNEIAKSVSEAARGSGEITNSISGVAQAAQSTANGASDTKKASEELSKMLSDLQRFVG
ncbi:MAG TPA: methyl-accepting chemotaxis protein [Fibrobacteria bacterium]|nr:methyl-accepting chemotaxis protein [Fibrobacteria bacterium]